MQSFFRSALFKVVLVITAFLFGLIIFEVSTGSSVPLEKFFGFIVKPCIEFSSGLNSAISGFFDSVFSGQKYKDENELLKDEIAGVQSKLIQYDSLKRENEQLKQVAHIKSLNKDADVISATVVSKPADNLADFVINVGSDHGIVENLPVITKRGLVGVVRKVFNTYSKVTTIISMNVSIPSLDASKGDLGIVSGRADLIKDGLCVMFHLNKETHVAPGDIISTSGGSEVSCPSNILIGKVRDVIISPNGISSCAIIEPAENVLSVRDVLILKNFQGQNFSMPE